VGFVSSLIALRKEHAVFRSGEWLSTDGEASRLVWYHADGREASESDFAGGAPHPLQVLLQGGDDGADFVVMFNPTPVDVVFNPPGAGGGQPWLATLNTASGVLPDERKPTEVKASIAVTSHALVAAGRLR
jgi:pullulanase/glycogen debranching enzyme